MANMTDWATTVNVVQRSDSEIELGPSSLTWHTWPGADVRRTSGPRHTCNSAGKTKECVAPY